VLADSSVVGSGLFIDTIVKRRAGH